MDHALVLPLSTALHAHLPAALLGRLAYLESLLLLSPPARLLRHIGLSPRAVLVLATPALAAVAARWRHQWRVLVLFLGLAEAVGRTVDVLERLDAAAAAQDDDDDDDVREDTQHLLSFWLVFALVQLHASLRPASPSPSLPFVLPDILARFLPRRLGQTRSRFPEPRPFPSPSSGSAAPGASNVPPRLLHLAILLFALHPSLSLHSLLSPLFAVSRLRPAKPRSQVLVVPTSPDPSSSAPATPAHIPYRLTSKANPLQAHARSRASSSSSSASRGTVSPSLASRVGSSPSSAGYDLHDDEEPWHKPKELTEDQAW